jgi:hypothetical protein
MFYGGFDKHDIHQWRETDMSKPYCKMSLKELLEHLRSASQELERLPKPPVGGQAKNPLVQGRKIGQLSMDEAAHRFIIQTGGVHPISRN